MSQALPKGYRIVYVKKSVRQKDSFLQPTSSESLSPKHTEFYIGEMYNELFPLDLFTKISSQAVDVYKAGFVAINSSLQFPL